MNRNRRLMVTAACLAFGLLGQLALGWHLHHFEDYPYPQLKRDFGAFPTVLGKAWRGVEHPGLPTLRQRLPYKADSLLWRHYQPIVPGLPAMDLYTVYSRTGADRKHHPEICLREALGAPEDRDERAIVYLAAGQQRPVQRFQFRTGTTRRTLVYYWHYTLEPAAPARRSVLQKLHERTARPAPSVTVQVSLQAPGPDGRRLVEEKLLVLIDEALRTGHLPASARIGCDRLPVILVGD